MLPGNYSLRPNEANYSSAFISLLGVNLVAFVAALHLRETHCRQIK